MSLAVLGATSTLVLALLGTLVVLLAGLPPVLSVVLAGAGGLVGVALTAALSFLLPDPDRQALRAVRALREELGLPATAGRRPVDREVEALGHELPGRLAVAERDGYARGRDELLARVEELQAALQSSTEARDAFLRRMSHELRTPLNAILGYTEMCLDEADDPELGADLERIRGSTLNLLGMVDAVLDLTQLQSGSYALHPELIDLAEVVANVQKSVRDDAERNRNRLDVEVTPELLVIQDRRMIRQILFNLAHNACKYTTGGRVGISADRGPLGVRLLVEDDGIGMTERQVQAAFRPFEQADTSTTRQYDGSGLGLAVCRGFAEAMGGSIRIDSEPGKGARIVVDLPSRVEGREVDDFDEDQPTILRR